MKTGLMIFCAISTLFSVGCVSQIAESTHANPISDDLAVARAIESACQIDDTCDLAIDVSDADENGGIKQQYTVKGCQVTIYNDGPIKMVNEKTDQPCNAPIPKDHDFGGIKRVYQENGCTITEYTHKNGIGDATMDCSERDLKK